MAKLKIKDWAPAEQPRQKLLLKGAEALTGHSDQQWCTRKKCDGALPGIIVPCAP